MRTLDLDRISVRELNRQLHHDPDRAWRVENPRGKHALSVGLTAECEVEIRGHVGYYCAGMNTRARITVVGSAGPGVAENMMSGTVRVTGNSSQYAGASGRGGLLVIEGNASSRCGISLKGLDIVVGGSVGHMSAFMAQAGTLLVCGDAGPDLGDSIYEAEIYVGGAVGSLGADCEEKEMRDSDREKVERLLASSGVTGADPGTFRRFGSARSLYHFSVDHAHRY